MTTPNNKEEKCEACDALGSFGIIPKESHTCSKFVSPTPDSMEKKPGAYDTFDMDDVKEGRVECVVGDPTDSWEKLTDGINENNIKEWSVKFVTKNSSRIALEMSIALIDAVMQLDTIGAEPKD